MLFASSRIPPAYIRYILYRSSLSGRVSSELPPTWVDELGAAANTDLWSTVTRALCVCVNNPQNGEKPMLDSFAIFLPEKIFQTAVYPFLFSEENQRVCTEVFPHAFKFLQEHQEAKIVRPIVSFIGLTAANNGEFDRLLHVAYRTPFFCPVARAICSGNEFTCVELFLKC